jgi:NAD(P)-dependent dehydrogenase (short-subunit alcohol dehydrogenase family)
MFADKHVLITGGSEGLGLALAKLLVTQNARVTLIARTLSKLQAAEAAVLQCCLDRQHQQQVVYCHSADVTKYNQVVDSTFSARIRPPPGKRSQFGTGAAGGRCSTSCRVSSWTCRCADLLCRSSGIG